MDRGARGVLRCLVRRAGQPSAAAAQCAYFAVGRKTSICHATTSTKNPYSPLKVGQADCVNIHSPHPLDYVQVNDPKCKGGGCLPTGAPADGTIQCCEGLMAVGGVCVACDTYCDDGNPCTVDSCSNGTCAHTFITDRVRQGVVCNDGIDCTFDTCDPSLGCQHIDEPCDDGKSCTTDVCDHTVGCTFTDILCAGGMTLCLVDSLRRYGVQRPARSSRGTVQP